MQEKKQSPIESFVKKYMESIGGVWDEIEPQVYDVLLPPDRKVLTDKDMLKLTFDPEALDEYPNAELVTYGTPLLESFLSDAQRQFAFTKQYLLAGFHRPDYEIQKQVKRELHVPDDVTMEFGDLHPLYFANALLWFRATFTSDEKEQEIFSTGVNLYYGRQVRHLNELLRKGSFSEKRPMPYPDASRISLAKVYQIAISSVIGTVSAVGNTHKREMEKRVAKQIKRMTQYFHDLREELKERIERALKREFDTDKLYERLKAIDREEQIRIMELKEKTAMRIQLQLKNLMMLMQPKLQMQVNLIPKEGKPVSVSLVWDPFWSKLEAPQCPACGRPTLSLQFNRYNQLICPECSTKKF